MRRKEVLSCAWFAVLLAMLAYLLLDATETENAGLLLALLFALLF